MVVIWKELNIELKEVIVLGVFCRVVEEGMNIIILVGNFVYLIYIVSGEVFLERK